MRMKRSNVLLGSRRVKKDPAVKPRVRGMKTTGTFKTICFKPSKVAIADDTSAYQLFGDRIFCAPQEDILEGT
jgi:hypothetical protein